MRKIASIDLSMVNLCDDMITRLNLSKDDLERNLINSCLYDLGFEVGFCIPFDDVQYQMIKESIFPIIILQVIGIPSDASFQINKYTNLYIIDFYF